MFLSDIDTESNWLVQFCLCFVMTTVSTEGFVVLGNGPNPVKQGETYTANPLDGPLNLFIMKSIEPIIELIIIEESLPLNPVHQFVTWAECYTHYCTSDGGVLWFKMFLLIKKTGSLKRILKERKSFHNDSDETVKSTSTSQVYKTHFVELS